MTKRKKKGIIIIGVLGTLAVLAAVMFFWMGKKTKDALAKQVNAVIDMSQVKDGTYQGSSDGGMVHVEVEVAVKDHNIVSINLVKHENGKGKPAEAMIDQMIEKNTDDVDEVSGATASSKTIRNAVNVALQKGL